MGFYILISLIITLFCIIFFFWGRIYEFFSHHKREYPENWLRYQSRLLYECVEKNHDNGLTLDSFFIRNGYKKIVIYAAGGIYYNALMGSINKDNYDIILADSNSVRAEKKLGEKVYAKEDLLKLSFDIIVITSVAHFFDIYKELIKLGISKDIVSYSDLVYNASKEG